jgi:hypothetical protein
MGPSRNSPGILEPGSAQTHQEGAVKLTWKKGGYVNSLSLSADGAILSSTDPLQSFVKATRVNLGKMYEDGVGVKEDWAEAVRWYRKSAEQGYPEGQFNLGRAYQFGMAVPQNRQEAIRWFDKAGDQGHDQANYFANDLKQRNRYIGFRNEQEHAAVVGLKLRSVLLNIEPVGRTFRDSGERMAYLRQAGKQADYEEAMQQWNHKDREYKACRDARRSGCIEPGPPP